MLRVTKSIIDGLGVRLPERRVTTAEILDGCENSIRLPLERLTGIHERRLAGDGLFSIDLAEDAIKACLAKSPVDAADYDLLVCTNISRRDAADQFTYEPGATLTLKKRLGFDNALAIDLTNACAGMWTGVYLVDALIRTGEIRHGMVVSGEYISYLIENAQREITSFMDPQIASLTLGDAGVAVSLGLSPSPEVGLHDLDLYTLSKYSPYCIAKPTDKEHGGAVMYTDAIKVTEAVVPHAARHAKLVVDRNGWPLDRIDHIVPHQTSQLTMQEAKKEIQRLYKYDFGDCFLNNLAERGNTSSNSHFLALSDAINGGRIKAGDDVAFCISGSGQTTGTALYTMDELPTRLMNGNGQHRPAVGASTPAATLPVQLEIESVGLSKPECGDKADTLEMLTAAAEKCLATSTYSREQIDLLISVGTYRSDFVMEPA
ncbi:MAG: 3-oxoacyl-[acyl-carrier-protein] synthase III C-terminal domain-containing protein, partial [Planctomycetota bacterium]